jgi:LPXTG-motif cell wall-anchored protein
MKSSLFSVVFACIASLFLVSTLSAASGDSTTGTTVSSETPLLVETITAIDDSHITLVFNQDIIRESVRVRITQQSDEQNVRIESFTGGADANSISVTLSDTLQTSTSYKMTIISAISDIGIIIKDGADGIKEFTTPTTLKKYAPTLNAPSNPTAIIASGSSIGTGSTGAIMKSGESQKDPTPSETTDELPLTGVNSTIFAVLAGAIALLVIARRRRA